MNSSDRSYSYYLFDFWNYLGDTRVNDWAFMKNGPWKLTLVVILYLISVTIIGPALMKNRKPMNPQFWIFWYNIFNIVTNGGGFLIALALSRGGIDSWTCGPLPEKDELQWKQTIFLHLGWWYMITKLMDFIDTVFFLLRKKINQVTFLHVSHHALMPYPMWMGVRLNPTPYMLFMPLANVFVHMVMYTYYLMASYEQMKPYLWWKKHITQLQLVQFVLVFIHGLRGFINPSCHYPRFLACMQFTYALYFFFLFSNFYYHAYVKRSQTAKVKSG